MNNYNDECIQDYSCPDCNDAKLQSEKNARKINEVIVQVNNLIEVNNEMDDIIEEKVNEVIGELNTEIDNINSSLTDLESEVNELKEGNIDLTDYATKVELNNKADKEHTHNQYLTEHQDLSSYATKVELHSHSNKTVLDNITTSKITEWDNKSNFSGSYTDLTNKPTIPTKTSQLTNDSGFITSIPSDYTNTLNSKADKTELHSHSNKTVLDGITTTNITNWNNKSNFSGNYNDLTNKPTIPTKTSQLTNDSGYLTQHQDLSNYATKTQVNAFDTLTLGINQNDGLMYIYKQGIPMGLGVEIGVKGDVVGYIDSDNNIILSGALANDTYTVKYEMEDGTLLDIGVLKNSDEPVFTNKIPLSIGSDNKPFNGGQGWKTGYRLSGSSGNESSQANIEVTGFIPCKMGDTIYIKGITDDGSHVMGIYDSSFTTIATATNNEKFTLDGSVVSVIINSSFSSIKDETNTAYFRISANTIDNNSIITVNQPLS